jgi:transposase-like protein
MEDYPKTVAELEQRFSTEDACREYLFQLRWPKGFLCPVCGQSEAWKLKGGLFKCTACAHKTSVIAETLFEGTRKPLVSWFRVIWWVTSQKNGASALGLQRILGLGSYETAWAWLHKLRRAMVTPGRDRLSGTIQVDETYIGGEKPGKRGRGAKGKALVLIAAQEDGKVTGRIRLKQIADASAESLEGAIQETVEQGAIVKTDDWNGYKGLESLGYRHPVVRKTATIGDNLLPLCHREAALIKRWLTGTHQGAVSHEHLGYYLDEYTFRFNRRTSRYRGKLFYRLLQNAIAVDAIPYQEIAKGIRRQKSQNTISSG